MTDPFQTGSEAAPTLACINQRSCSPNLQKLNSNWMIAHRTKIPFSFGKNLNAAVENK